ncbi:unnamed protein product [Phytophthora fragariaefolia]|uniref:Unnamed protein product n=1 Tax=Phytophthora fragariaefolia TaxID=1490495 RepID=A0A9W6XQU2_9STRA|nr:unnamed protein product [Phytophthora fragariaefolia]
MEFKATDRAVNPVGRAVVQYAIETGLIQDDVKSASGEVSDREDSEMVRASQIDCSVALSANTIDALFGSDSEDGEVPALSQNAVGRTFKLSQSDAADAVNATEQSVVIGAFQRLLSETEPDPHSGDDSVEETNVDRGCDDDGGPLVPRDPADVNLMKPGDPRDDLSDLSQTMTGRLTTRSRLTWMQPLSRRWVAP